MDAVVNEAATEHEAEAADPGKSKRPRASSGSHLASATAKQRVQIAKCTR